MRQTKNKNLKYFLIDNSEIFSNKTVKGLLRSLFEPIVSDNCESLILYRIKNASSIEGILKRLEFSSNVEMHSFLDNDVVKNDDLVELEFVLITSNRYNAALIWDYSDFEDKKQTNLYIKMNSKDVNDVYEVIKQKSKIDFDEKFYSFKPERRDNILLNEAIFNMVKMLNENVVENDFNFKQQVTEEKTENSLVAHEIKNQLSILDVYSKILEKELGKNKNIALINKAISHIRLQLDDLKSNTSVSLEKINIADVIEKSVEILNYTVKENNNKVKFINNLKEKTEFKSNEDRLFFVLNNIVKNANEVTKKDEIEIELNKQSNKVLISITNHGDEISQENQKMLFNKGFTTKKTGEGLGLVICEKYLAQIGGKIELIHSNNKETKFLITLLI